MNIETLITCRGYADYLSHTLRSAVQFSDEVMVITSQDDVETSNFVFHSRFPVERLGGSRGASCVMTSAFDYCGGPFNKGAAINEGLQGMRRADWVLILDADILIPPGLRQFLESGKLDPEKLYGIDRRNCPGFGTLEHCLETRGFANLPLMPRVSILGAEPPPGYFQLFHTSAMPHGPWYEDTYPYADRTDMTFARRFARYEYLPSWVVHLDTGTESHTGGANWRGRKTPRFV